MKIFISADIEGVVGISNWCEARKEDKDYDMFALEMTKEVAACVEGLTEAGAKEVVIKDAHGTARNIDPSLLPENAKLIRGWTGHPFRMVEQLDNTFDAIAFVGYHSKAGSNTNSLAHTINSSVINYIKINGEYASEFLIHSYVASYLNIPVIFISGDEGICNEAKEINENITTVSTIKGKGEASISLSTKKALKLIKENAKKSLSKDTSNNIILLPEKFDVEVCYNRHYDAYKNSFFPGVKQTSEKLIEFTSEDYFEVMRTLIFII